MPSSVEIAPGRYRESYGRYLEDFKVGDIYEHRPGRTITETDNAPAAPLPRLITPGSHCSP